LIVGMDPRRDRGIAGTYLGHSRPVLRHRLRDRLGHHVRMLYRVGIAGKF
jgi:hypothetical protein